MVAVVDLKHWSYFMLWCRLFVRSAGRYGNSVGAPKIPMLTQLLNFVRANRLGGADGVQKLQEVSEAEELLRKREALLERRKEDAEKWLQSRREALAKNQHTERTRRLKELEESRRLQLMHKKQHQQKQVRHI